MSMKKIGVFTSAIALIALGIIIVLHTGGLVSYNILKYLWPALVILFGVEILWSRYQPRDTPIRFSGFGIALIIVVLILSLVQSVFTGIGWFNAYLEPVNGHVHIDSSVKRVYIEIPDGKVTVTGTEAQDLTYDGQLDVGASSKTDADKFIRSDWTVRQTGDTLDLIFNHHSQFLALGLGGLVHAPYLNVEVPSGLLSRVRTSNGQVFVSSMNADSDVRSSNGSVTMEHIQGNATISTSNGSVSINDISGVIDAHTTNGSIKGQSVVGGNWVCTTTNGSIKLSIPADSNANIDAKTSNGKIDGDVSWQFDKKHHARVALGHGGKQIWLTTSNSSVTVNLMH
jgi:hypothetical protein